MSEASAASVSQFFTNSDFSIHEAADPSQTAKVEDPLLFFNVNETAAWIRTNAFKRVALQFPDSFLHYACFVSEKLVELVGDLKTFVLADTSYRSCCVDFVAAAHARCDALVHYGDACLSSPSTEIPCRFVLGRLPTQIEDCCEQLSSQISGLEQKSAIIISDSAYDYILETLTALMKAKFPEKSFQESRVILNQTKTEKKLVLGREVNEPSGEEGPFIIFIGASSSSLLPIWLMTFPEIDTVVSYDPVEKRSTLERSYSTRQLRKRLFMVEKLKDANSVGLVVGTVGLEGHREAVSRMRALCKAAVKKIYVISVGKVNVPKLSNFSADIDVFVLVSCPFGILLDTSDFYKPVLSLFEAEVALNPSNSWAAGAGWTADFSKFLHDSIGESRDESDMSLLTGKVRAKPTDQLAEDGHLEGGQVALYTAGDYFKQRSWRGLDDSIRTEEETGVTEGRAGIAASYIQEPSK